MALISTSSLHPSNLPSLDLQGSLGNHFLVIEQAQLQELINSHAEDPEWHEIFLLLVDLVPNPKEILLQLENISGEYINTPRLQRLMDWIEFITSDDSGVPGSLAHQIFASLLALTSLQDSVPARILILLQVLTLVNGSGLVGNLDAMRMRAYTLANTFPIALADWAYQLICQLDTLGIFSRVNLTHLSADLAILVSPSGKTTTSESEAKLLWSIVLDAFQLDQELLKLSQLEIENLKSYLNLSIFLVQCNRTRMHS